MAIRSLHPQELKVGQRWTNDYGYTLRIDRIQGNKIYYTFVATPSDSGLEAGYQSFVRNSLNLSNPELDEVSTVNKILEAYEE